LVFLWWKTKKNGEGKDEIMRGGTTMGDEIGDIISGGTKINGVDWGNKIDGRKEGEELTFSIIVSSLPTVFSEGMKFVAPASEGSTFSIFCKVQFAHLKMLHCLMRL
jgi:hypothetical protein